MIETFIEDASCASGFVVIVFGVLGHVDIHTTQIYAYISNKDLQGKINLAFGSKKQKAKKYELTRDHLNLLKLKFASGEIDLEEFREKYALLQSLDSVKSSVF